jgi:hypothetical protein
MYPICRNENSILIWNIDETLLRDEGIVGRLTLKCIVRK